MQLNWQKKCTNDDTDDGIQTTDLRNAIAVLKPPDHATNVATTNLLC